MESGFVLPKVYLIGYTTLDLNNLNEYLTDTDQLEFLDDIGESKSKGLSDGEIMCSFYAKACYASLTTKKNKNITKTRPIYDNILGIIKSGHGSVLEHCMLNFMITNCSRVFTHELVRHRAGTAFSQTSGRYVRNETLDLVIDPILNPINDLVQEARNYLENWYNKAQEKLELDSMKDFGIKKKLTSALRRLLPNGQANEIGFSVNLRELRHTIETRTSEHAEWEIRYIFNQVYKIVKQKYPSIFFDATEVLKDDLLEITFSNKKV